MRIVMIGVAHSGWRGFLPTFAGLLPGRKALGFALIGLGTDYCHLLSNDRLDISVPPGA